LKISKIILYNEPSVPEINIKKAEKFLLETFEVEIQIRENIFKKLDKKTYEKIASTKIFNLKKPFQKYIPSIEDILIESENKDMSNKEEMTLYDGIELNKIITELIPKTRKHSRYIKHNFYK
jgi:hypothetical protein